MAIRRLTSEFGTDLIATGDIAADAVTIAKLATDTGITTSHHKIPSVTTANLPGAGTNASVTAVNGMLVYNSTLGMLQQRSAGTWKGIASSPSITSVSGYNIYNITVVTGTKKIRFA